jgi:hypothetical protein
MVKVIKTLKEENGFLKGKCENSDVALVKLIEEVMCIEKLTVLKQGSVETIAFAYYTNFPARFH